MTRAEYILVQKERAADDLAYLLSELELFGDLPTAELAAAVGYEGRIGALARRLYRAGRKDLASRFERVAKRQKRERELQD